jgi:glucose/mannose transport system permease protein
VTASLSGNGKTTTVARRTSPMAALADRWIPKLVLSPSIVISLVFVYGFIFITGFLSLSNSRLMPRYEFVGLDRYRELFDNDVWWTSAANLGWFGIPFIAICVGLGLFLAILLDQQIRNEGALRAVFLYPMALSFIVTGTAWQWILNPNLGMQKVLHDWGWTSFQFDWLDNPDRAIFCIVIAAVWQSTGFVMALFLAGLRGVDAEIFKAAQVDGATLPTIYRKIVIPSMRPVFFSVLLILCHITIKTFDRRVARVPRRRCPRCSCTRFRLTAGNWASARRRR